jgi:AcrR family transcriptional regulator
MADNLGQPVVPAGDPAGGLRALPLRERKRALTRRAILDAAERLFEERGFEHVPVAQIADAANVSVKTLFVYFRSKQDLVFTDTSLLDTCAAAIEGRSPGVSPGQALAAALIGVLRDGRQAGPPTGPPSVPPSVPQTVPQTVAEEIEGFHRGYGGSRALDARLLRIWEEYEDRITAVLAAETGAAPTPATRLRATGLVGILRCLTSAEMRAAVAGRTPRDGLAYVCDWLLAAGETA